MGFLENILKLKEKENKIFLFLLIWFLIAFTVMQITIYLNYAIIGIFFYFPLLGFTLFLWFISFSNVKIREYSIPKLFLLILLEFLLVIVFVILTVIFMIVSIFTYIFFTSFFSLYGCYQMGKELDERLYYRKLSWLWRGLEFFGGLILSVLLLLVFLFATWEATRIVGVTEIISVAYIVVIGVIASLTVYMVVSGVKRKFNAWLGTYFLLITFYTVYLVLRIFMGIASAGPTTSTSDDLAASGIFVALLLLDLFILIYSISCILGSQGEILAEKLPHFKQETLLLWLIFSKISWEYAANFPYGTLGIVQGIGIQEVQILGILLRVVVSVVVLIIFIVLTIVFGVKGIRRYGDEIELMKKGKEEMIYSKKTGERKDATLEPSEQDIIEVDKEEDGELESGEEEQKEDVVLDDS
jgi:hypothetical protein